MFSAGKHLVAIASAPLAIAVMGLPATTFAAETPALPLIEAPAAPIIAPPALQSTGAPASPVLANADPAVASDSETTWGNAAPVPAASASASAEMDAELECMAKVVHHEAGNQPRRGQLAVAQLIMNRIESGRFADTICGVANQPRQFFRTSTYNPRRDTPMWASAVEVSREARAGSGAEVVPGALFFHASYTSGGSFFRSRERVTTLGGHVFYR
ncbi:MAG: cell wall hydrolase SleB [Sphingomonas bacterium]|nr:cell wall hydrolase SleB [Sphingomonas bacterium]